MSRTSRCLAASSAALWVLLCSSAGHAQVDDARQAAIRRTMIENAQRAQGSGQFAECAELAQRATTIQDTGSLRRLLAECQLSAGRIVEAIGNGELCLSLLRRDERAVGREVHSAACQRVVSDGRARSAQLVVRTPTPEPANLRVLISGHPLDRVEWNIATLAAAGPLVIEATADGMQPFRHNLDATRGAVNEVQITFVPLPTTRSAGEPGRETETHANTNANATTSAAVEQRPRSRPETLRAAPSSVSPWVVAGGVTAGVGVVGTIVGFAVPAAMVAGYDARCGAAAPAPMYDRCVAEARDGQGALDALSGVGIASLVLTGAGAAMLVGGLVTGRASGERAPTVAIAPMVHGRAQGASVLVRW